jgi:transglutaminase-like putative cysteine protease
LVGFAVAEFGVDATVEERVSAITEWIRERVGYVAGSSSVHDSAEHTLLTGMGTCRDFAHLGVALCRAVGIPARFTSVYAPGLFPMDFHAVFEVIEQGRWYAFDATDLAPRPAMVRIATGRDAADTAFASVISGIATLESLEVTATVDGELPRDDRTQRVELA